MTDAATWKVEPATSYGAADATRRRCLVTSAVSLVVAAAAGAAFASGLLNVAARGGVFNPRGVHHEMLAPLMGFAGAASAVAALGAMVGAAHAGKTGWAIARRATEARRSFDTFDRLGDAVPKAILVLGLAALVVGVGLGFFDAPPPFAAAPAVLAELACLAAVVGSVVRWSQVAAALGLMNRLETTTLGELERREGDVELGVRVPADAEMISLPFLAEPVAAAELRLCVDGAWSSHAWPASLRVEDAGGDGALALDAIELGGPRNANGVILRPAGQPEDDAAARLRAFEEATGAKLQGLDGSAFVNWAVWTILPGDRLYVLGDAPAVRGGVGAYRGGAVDRAVRGSAERAAIAFVGDEARITSLCSRELRQQLAAAALSLALAVGLGVAAYAAVTGAA